MLNAESSAFAAAHHIRLIAADFIEVVYLPVPGDFNAALSDHPLVFTSRHGVLGFEKMTHVSGAPVKKREVYCLGGETKRTVESMPWLAIKGTAQHAAALAALIIAENKSRTFNYICGSGRRDELPGVLHASGIVVNELHVYETRLRPKRITSLYDAVLFFSPSAVDSYFQSNLLPVDTPCFCIGETTAQAVVSHGGKAIVASKPEQIAVLEKVSAHFTSPIRKK